MIDGDFKLTESQAIAAYLCIKGGHPELLGEGAQGRSQVSMLVGVINDVTEEVFKTAFSDKNYVQNLKTLAIVG